MAALALSPWCHRGSSTVHSAPWAHPLRPCRLGLRRDQFMPWALKGLERPGRGPSCGSWWAEALISRGHQINTAAPAGMGAGWPGCRQGCSEPFISSTQPQCAFLEGFGIINIISILDCVVKKKISCERAAPVLPFPKAVGCQAT